VVGGKIPREYISSCDNGFRQGLDRGVLIGFPVVGVEMELNDGGAHAVDSSDMAFQIAARAAFKETMPKAGPFILEPVMRVVVETPEEFQGGIQGGLVRRRGNIVGSDSAMGTSVIEAHMCRSPTCSATRPSCARTRRARPSTRWSSSATSRSRRTSRTSWSASTRITRRASARCEGPQGPLKARRPSSLRAAFVFAWWPGRSRAQSAASLAQGVAALERGAVAGAGEEGGQELAGAGAGVGGGDAQEGGDELLLDEAELAGVGDGVGEGEVSSSGLELALARGPRSCAGPG
jgi:hypothetical protein